MRREPRGKSAELTRSPFLSLFFRFRAFFVRMWLWFACQRLSLPLPNFLKRFIAARFVFCFGIDLLLKNGRDGVPPLQLRAEARRNRHFGARTIVMLRPSSFASISTLPTSASS